MTKQLVIKLNEERFKPLFNALRARGEGVMSSDSALVGICIFSAHVLGHVKFPVLGDKTALEFLSEKQGVSKEKLILGVMGAYQEFLKTGKIRAAFDGEKVD